MWINVRSVSMWWWHTHAITHTFYLSTIMMRMTQQNKSHSKSLEVNTLLHLIVLQIIWSLKHLPLRLGIYQINSCLCSTYSKTHGSGWDFCWLCLSICITADNKSGKVTFRDHIVSKLFSLFFFFFERSEYFYTSKMY